MHRFYVLCKKRANYEAIRFYAKNMPKMLLCKKRANNILILHARIMPIMKRCAFMQETCQKQAHARTMPIIF